MCYLFSNCHARIVSRRRRRRRRRVTERRRRRRNLSQPMEGIVRAVVGQASAAAAGTVQVVVVGVERVVADRLDQAAAVVAANVLGKVLKEFPT